MTFEVFVSIASSSVEFPSLVFSHAFRNTSYCWLLHMILALDHYVACMYIRQLIVGGKRCIG